MCSLIKQLLQCKRMQQALRLNRPDSVASDPIWEAIQGVKATSDTALKTGDMGLSKHRQATRLNWQNTMYSDTISSISLHDFEGSVNRWPLMGCIQTESRRSDFLGFIRRCKNFVFWAFVLLYGKSYCLKCFCFLCFTSSVSFTCTGSYTKVKPIFFLFIC